MSGPDALDRLESAERRDPTREPKFSVRFAPGRAELSLSAPLAFRAAVLSQLGLTMERTSRVTDFSRGWRALSRRRSVLTRAEISLEPAPWLGLSDAGDDDGTLTSADRQLVVQVRRPWGHVAIELAPVLDRTDGARQVLLVPRGARSVHAGPRPPLAEVIPLAAAMAARLEATGMPLAPRFDANRGAIVVGDLVFCALTEALIAHGVRIPERGLSAERVELRGGRLVLTVGGPFEADPDGAQRELGRRLGPLVVQAACGDAIDGDALLELPPAVAQALADGGDDACSRLRRAVNDGASPAEVTAHALAVDAVEPAAGVATDALLLAIEHGADTQVSRELALRAFARSPERADVMAWALAMASQSIVPAVAAEILERAEAAVRARGDAPDPQLQIALARLDEQRGDHEAAFARWKRATELSATPGDVFEGLSRQLARRGRLDEALSALDRGATLHRARGRARAALRAELAAAHVALTAREPLLTLARLDALTDQHAPEDRAEVFVDLVTMRARALRAASEPQRAALVEGELLRHVEIQATRASEAAVAALFDAARAALEGDEGARADAIGATLARARPEENWGEKLALLERTLAIGRMERATSGRAELARELGGRMLARGHAEDAAELLVRAGELDRDLALIRAGIDLAERTGNEALARALIGRTLPLVGDGPARAALEERSRKLTP